MSNPAVRLGASTLVLTAVFAASACKDNSTNDDSKSSPKAGPPTTATSAPSTPAPSPPSPSSTAVPRTTAAAIARYTTLLHALGRGDFKTACVIAGPAQKKAQAQGFGNCPSTFSIMTSQMMSARQRNALRTATIDKSKVTKTSRGTVNIPAGAIVAHVRYTEEQMGISQLAYRKGNWFVID